MTHNNQQMTITSGLMSTTNNKSNNELLKGNNQYSVHMFYIHANHMSLMSDVNILRCHYVSTQ